MIPRVVIWIGMPFRFIFKLASYVSLGILSPGMLTDPDFPFTWEWVRTGRIK